MINWRRNCNVKKPISVSIGHKINVSFSFLCFLSLNHNFEEDWRSFSSVIFLDYLTSCPRHIIPRRKSNVSKRRFIKRNKSSKSYLDRFLFSQWKISRVSLEQSCHELQNTAVELEKRLKMIDEESMWNFSVFFQSLISLTPGIFIEEKQHISFL